MLIPSELRFSDLAPKFLLHASQDLTSVLLRFELFTFIFIIANLVRRVVLLTLSKLIRYWLCSARFLPLFDWCVKWWPGAGVSFVYTLTAVARL